MDRGIETSAQLKTGNMDGAGGRRPERLSDAADRGRGDHAAGQRGLKEDPELFTPDLDSATRGSHGRELERGSRKSQGGSRRSPVSGKVAPMGGQETPRLKRSRKPKRRGEVLVEGKPAEEGRMRQPVDDGESTVSDWPSPEDFELVADAVEKVLHNHETRAAWIMGFLTGSALVEDPDWATKLERTRRPLPRGA